MFTKISSLIAIIKALIDLVKYFNQWQENQKIKEQLKKSQDREKAIDDLKKAETEDEIWDGQDRIVGNKP